MGPKDVLAKSMDMSDFIMNKYLGDLTDADLKIVPVEGMHPIALQLGHLISAERMFIEYVSPGLSPELPAGFSENHSLKEAVPDRKFATKDEYLKLWAAQRAATKKSLDSVSDADLTDTRDGKLPKFFATVGDVFNMVAIHSLNHSGQFVAVRRLLKKPIAF
jgi:DinB superfamily